VLATKVGVVAAVLVVAAQARHRVRVRLDHAGAVVGLVGVELALLVVVLTLTAVLLAQAPPT
jgi:putative copper export protein